MKRQFVFSFKALIKSSKFYKCIIFALLLAFLLEFIMLKKQGNLYDIGSPDYGFFLISRGEGNVLDLLMLSLPLLAIIPFGDTFYKEREFINQMFTRTSKGKYLIVNTLMAFITGFLFVFVMLSFMYFLNYLILKPSVDNPFYYMVSTVVENNNLPILTYSFFVTELLEHPTLFNWIFIVILSAYAGLLSMTTFSISLCVKNKIIAFILPFAITTISVIAMAFVPGDFDKWTAHMVFSPGGNMILNHGFAVFFWVSLFLILSVSFNIYKYRKDVLE